VYHYAHRIAHTAIILEGEVLPECKLCGDSVRFVPMMPATPIAEDRGFVQAAEGKAAS